MEPFLLLAVLICPVVMGGMMLWMMIRMRSGSAGADRTHEDDR
ncbi:MAG TPA: hypothetical protein VI409_09860 [Gaiellaceae bacterium]|nr:hypothetical protein [Gaiellaceae bacterium]